MSMTSAVSPTLRQQIINVLKNPLGIGVSNGAIEYRTQYAFSLRKIQEATQKMTKDGTLEKYKSFGVTYYRLATPTGVAV